MRGQPAIEKPRGAQEQLKCEAGPRLTAFEDRRDEQPSLFRPGPMPSLSWEALEGGLFWNGAGMRRNAWHHVAVGRLRTAPLMDAVPLGL